MRLSQVTLIILLFVFVVIALMIVRDMEKLLEEVEAKP